MYRSAERVKNFRPPSFIMRALPPGTQYLGEDETYWYFSHPGANPALGDFFSDVGKMFSRMVKFTPKSFTPGNIYTGFVNTTLTTLTAGAYQFLPKSLKKTVYDVGKVAIPVIAGGVVAYTAGPAVWGMIGPKLTAAGNILGKAASTVGGKFLDILGKFGSSQQAAIAQAATPEQIAQMDQTGQIPYDLQRVIDQAAAANFQPQPVYQTPGYAGAASLYNPEAMAARDAGQQPVAMAGAFDMTTLALMTAGGLAIYLVLGKK